MKSFYRYRLLIISMPVWVLLFGVLAVYAQGSVPTPIAIGENKTGEITAAAPVVSYSLTVTSAQNVQVETFGITSGFSPGFTVYDPANVVVQSALNTTNQTAVQAPLILSSPGTYRIDVQSSNGQVGQFLLSVQPGTALPPALPISPGQSLDGSVSAQTPIQIYAFASSQLDNLLLTVTSSLPASGSTVTLREATTGETLAVNSAKLSGVRYRIPNGVASYQLEVTHSGSPAAEAYTVCLENETGPLTCSGGTQTALVPTVTIAAPTDQPLPPLPSTGPCIVASATGGRINVRGGPGVDFPVVGQLTGLTTAPVTGTLPDHSWYQIDVSSITGWVSATVIRIGGECGSVSNISLTPTATTSGPTLTPTVTATPTATITPGGPTPTHGLIIPTFILHATLQIQIQPKLDYTAAATYGEANLSAGFSPDPYSVGMTVGGQVDVSYLGGSCSGFASTAPSLRINFGGGGASLLRIYFVGANGDSSIIINDPYGNFYCVDDSFGTVNPTIDFNNPAGGSYDVWVGSYAANTNISGTLYLTSNSGNHP